MSLETVRQLIQTLAPYVPTKADDSAYVSMIMAFNADLADAQRLYPQHPLLATLSPAQEQIPIGDLLTRAERLHAILQEEQDQARAQQSRRANQARREQFRLG